jgi:EmrB/QacA subfamily drug resistance transporter
MDRRWWTLAAVCAGVFMLLLDITIVNVALPEIARGFHASLSDLQWVIDAYALALAAFLLTGGSLADLYGRRVLFAAGITVFSLGSLACGLSTSSLSLIVARSVQGVGGAVMFATSLALLAQAFPAEERGVAFGVFGAITGVAIAVGPVLGGALTSGPGWRSIFYVNVPIGALALLVTLLRVDESRDPNATRPDWIGFLTFSGGLAAFVYALIRSGSAGWGSATVIGSLVLAAVLLGAFVVAERLQAEPMLDLRLLRVRTFNGGLFAAWAISASIFSALTFLVLYLQNVLGFSAVQAGIRFLPLTGAIFLTAGIAGRLTARVPRRLLIGPGFVLIAGGMLLMRGLTPTSAWTHLLPGMIVAGVGAGLVNVPLVSTAVGVVEPERAGMASGINSTLRQVGVATGVAALGSLFAARVRSTMIGHLAGTPLAAHAHQIAHVVSSGGAAHAAAGAPAPLRTLIAGAARAGVVSGLNEILLIGAIVALVGASLALLLIHERDFVVSEDAALAVAA